MKQKNLFFGGLLFAVIILLSASGGIDQKQDKMAGKSVKIGNQEWMSGNLNIEVFRNGDSIAEARSRTEWQRAFIEHKPVWCYYGNDSANGEKYGKLYNWYAVNDPRGLAPAGWHVPSDADWTRLTDYLGGAETAGYKMKSDSGWKELGNGNNQSGFSGLPGGASADDGYLGSIGYLGVWWSATADTSYYYDNTAYAWYRYLYYAKDNLVRYSHSKGNGFSVRCIRD
jgi:uncharacterized protein (TIGR02145 family)